MGMTCVIEKTFEKLLDSYNDNGNDKRKKEKLKFPPYRGLTIRVSEQEARLCFAWIIEKETDYRYSVETPTQKTYQPSGKSGLSARSDMSIWSRDGIRKLCNIEFKAHNARKESIDKDIEKLVREEIAGIWFHVFRNADEKTFPTFTKKLEDSLIKYDKYREKDIIFAICVLEQKVGMYGTLSPDKESPEEIKDFFEEASGLIKADLKKETTHWKEDRVWKICHYLES